MCSPAIDPTRKDSYTRAAFRAMDPTRSTAGKTGLALSLLGIDAGVMTGAAIAQGVGDAERTTANETAEQLADEQREAAATRVDPFKTTADTARMMRISSARAQGYRPFFSTP